MAVNPHSIFILELNQKEVSKYFVRSQRALLEISRVSYTIGKAVKVVYKASQGGDHVTFYMKNPIDCVKAISGHLKRLGIQGNEAGASSRKKKQIVNNNNNINNNNNNDTFLFLFLLYTFSSYFVIITYFLRSSIFYCC